MKVIIVGGVAGGASAAARIRRLSENAEIIVYERGPDVSFANCGLPYFIGGEIESRDQLLVASPSVLSGRLKLDVRARTSVESIDRVARTVRVRDMVSSRESVETYDKLILATGAAPVRPAIPGIDAPGVFTLRTLQDAETIKQHVRGAARQVVLLGGGFINLELAENLARLGISATIVERGPQILAPFDPEMTAPIVQELSSRGITLILGQAAEGIESVERGLSVCLTSGQKIPADVVVVGIGVRPDNRLAVEAGLDVGARGGILVNEFLQTSDPNIYAVGDAIEVEDVVTCEPAQVPLAGPANRQGRIAADNVCGRRSIYRGTQGTAIVGFFGVTAAITGASEKTLKRAGMAYRKVYIHPMHHAGYFPGAEQMTLKVLFDPRSGDLLGAQGVGGEGVDKRIDVLSMALQGGLTVFDLEEAELAYAPQFGSAKDPINMLGFVAGGLLREDHPQGDPESLVAAAAGGTIQLLDVRTRGEFAVGHIPGALHIPVEELRGRLNEIPRDKPIAAYCQVGMRGYLATRILLQAGFQAVNVSGGYRLYRMFQTVAATTSAPVALAEAPAERRSPTGMAARR